MQRFCVRCAVLFLMRLSYATSTSASSRTRAQRPLRPRPEVRARFGRPAGALLRHERQTTERFTESRVPDYERQTSSNDQRLRRSRRASAQSTKPVTKRTAWRRLRSAASASLALSSTDWKRPGALRKSCDRLVARAGISAENVHRDELVVECQRGGLTVQACDHVLASLGVDLASPESLSTACQRRALDEAMLGSDRLVEQRAGRGGVEAAVTGNSKSLDGAVGASSAKEASAAASTINAVNLDASLLPKARLVNPGMQCKVMRRTRGMHTTLGACADAVQSRGGRYFMYGNTAKTRGKCYEQLTTAVGNVVCPEGWEKADYDSFKVDVQPMAGSCNRSADWCTAPDTVFEVLDCDRDGVLDPFCRGPLPGQSGYLSSERSCQDTSPYGGCFVRRLHAMGAVFGGEQLCVTALPPLDIRTGNSPVGIQSCTGGRILYKQWYFVGLHVLTPGLSGGCLMENRETHAVIVAKTCKGKDHYKWIHDRQERLSNMWSGRCIVRSTKPRVAEEADTEAPESDSLLTTAICDEAEAQKFRFSPERDCRWSRWGSWTVCSATCGWGSRTRYRYMVETADPGGLDCVGEASEVANCFRKRCPEDCELGAWSDWSTCPVSCLGEGDKGFGLKRSRERLVISKPELGGKLCKGQKSFEDELVTTETSRGCGKLPRCPIHCGWGAWSEWTKCSKPCDGGNISRTRSHLILPAFGGLPCRGIDLDVFACNRHACPVDCEWDPWTEFTACPRTCGDVANQRTRKVRKSSQNGGRHCRGAEIHVQNCAAGLCPVDCKWEAWSDWGPCSGSCGNNSQIRTRGHSKAMHGGKRCNGTKEGSKECNTQPCPVNCVLNEWEDWSECNEKMGNVCFMNRVRSEKKPAEHGGEKCKEIDFKDSAKCDKCAEE